MTKPMASAQVETLHGAWPYPLRGVLAAAWRGSSERRWNTLRYKIVALAIIGLVALTAAGWVLLGARELAVFRSAGAPALVEVMTPVASQAAAEAAGLGGQGAVVTAGREPINPAAFMPYWMVIDLLIFVALGLYLRWDLGRKS